MNMDHSPECVCEQCLRHEFLERVRSAVCHLCNRPRDHWTHQPAPAAAPARKPWASRLTSPKRSSER